MASMAPRRENSQPAATDLWKAVGWASVALLAVAAAQVLALPAHAPTAFALEERSDFWRPEWWVLASLVLYPVFLSARRCWWLAVPVAALVCVQFGFIATSGPAILADAGLAGALDPGWYAVGAAQIAGCAAVAGCGAARNLRHRRFVRTMNALMPEAVEAERSNWNEGFSTAG